MAETAGERKVVGAVWTLAAILGIASAFLIQPVAEWGGFGIVLAVLLALLGATGLWMLATGRGRIYGSSTSVKSQRILAVIGLIGSSLLILTYLLGDWASWTASDVLSISIWVALGAMFIDGLVSSRRRS